jgi:DNA-binding transcriptional LysR family regulator
LAGEQFIVREPGSGTREVAARVLAEHGVQLRRTMRIGGTEAIKQAVAAGLGLAIVSRAAAADQLALGRIAIVDVPDLVIRRTFTRLRLRGRTPTATARAFEELLDETEIVHSLPDASGA